MKKENFGNLTRKSQYLIRQVNKLFKNNNQKSIKTRYRYLAAEERFCKFLADNTNLQKIKNVKSKHFINYTNALKANNKSSSMIKTELAGVRFFHELTGSKERLPVNSRLDLQKVNFGGVERAWTPKEVKDVLNLANSMVRTDVEMAIKIAYSFGCRIEEVMTLTNAQSNKKRTKLGLQ